MRVEHDAVEDRSNEDNVLLASDDDRRPRTWPQLSTMTTHDEATTKTATMTMTTTAAVPQTNPPCGTCPPANGLFGSGAAPKVKVN